jgi:hypothetical protein
MGKLQPSSSWPVSIPVSAWSMFRPIMKYLYTKSRVRAIVQNVTRVSSCRHMPPPICSCRSDMTFPKLLNRRFSTSDSNPRVYPKMRLCFRMCQVPSFRLERKMIFTVSMPFTNETRWGVRAVVKRLAFESLPVV